MEGLLEEVVRFSTDALMHWGAEPCKELSTVLLPAALDAAAALLPAKQYAHAAAQIVAALCLPCAHCARSTAVKICSDFSASISVLEPSTQGSQGSQQRHPPLIRSCEEVSSTAVANALTAACRLQRHIMAACGDNSVHDDESAQVSTCAASVDIKRTASAQSHARMPAKDKHPSAMLQAHCDNCAQASTKVASAGATRTASMRSNACTPATDTHPAAMPQAQCAMCSSRLGPAASPIHLEDARHREDDDEEGGAGRCHRARSWGDGSLVSRARGLLHGLVLCGLAHR
ncbi:hypothetical protein DUNSADRAFT_12755 [Dunaliella salina]|uniref:Encoded protein n=1 Tax=Dunaliella salina TaxID=3046 RepID=A0ABQ7GAN6_DUNSA|nr:hypothetical protein DUNSADRAFT_12755 [Dunaliella salina]|eukprot:KAF5831674.1 hypothetical protein DUNSADRAFT_12755 [Dunaliella salina]